MRYAGVVGRAGTGWRSGQVTEHGTQVRGTRSSAGLASLAIPSSSRSTEIGVPLPKAIVRHNHSSSARDAVNMGLKGMAPSNTGEYVVTKLDDRTLMPPVSNISEVAPGSGIVVEIV